MKRLRLVFVTRRFWPLVGSEERGMANLAYGMSQLGHETQIVTARWEKRWPRQFVYRGVPVTRLDQSKRRGWGTIRYLRQLARWLRRHHEEVDAVLVSTLRYEAYTALGALRGTQVPVIIRVESGGQRGDCQWQRDAPLGARIRSRCLIADALIATTTVVHDELIGAGYPRQRVHMIAGGIEIPPPWSPRRQHAARHTLAETHPVFSLPASAPLVVCGGPLDRAEGVFELVDAWKQIVRRTPAARLWILGDGPHGPQLWERIKRYELESNVILPGSFDDCENVLRAANLFVRPAHDEGASVLFFEAMALGLPIVASNIAAHRQFLKPGKTGTLAPLKNADELATAIMSNLASRAAAVQLGMSARAQAEAELSLAQASKRYSDVTLQAIEQRRSDDRDSLQ